MASFGSTHLAIQQLRELQRLGWSSFDNQAAAVPTQEVLGHSGRSPSSWEIARWVGPIVARRIAHKVRRVATRRADLQHWRIALRVRRENLDLDGPVDMSGFRWVESPPGRLYADQLVNGQVLTTNNNPQTVNVKAGSSSNATAVGYVTPSIGIQKRAHRHGRASRQGIGGGHRPARRLGDDCGL